MARTKEYLSTVLTETFPKSIISHHVVIDEKPTAFDFLWQSIHTWKKSLSYMEKESTYFLKLARWNGTPSVSNKSKRVCDRFLVLVTKDLPRAIEKIDGIESEISVAMLDRRSNVKGLIRKFHALEEELNAFKMKIEENKLKMLDEIINSSAVSFF